ncbi:hypothetical protein [Kitasatospora sp. NPDC047058]|uniref:hypothetical protein n=1 Tax=Kitasatospora sp. NPDC047058 TaxID=3155620 RepID=UPI0033D95438
MTTTGQSPAAPLIGEYRDVLLDRFGQVVWDSGVRSNTIVTDCRRLLCGFLHSGSTTTQGITGLQVGKGQDSWDRSPGAPPALPGQIELADPNPFTVAADGLQIDYLAGTEISPEPTNQLQIVATLGPGQPPWPDTHHTDGTLREFGLVGNLDGKTVLIDYVIHPAIPRDPLSTLKRTIRLVL